VGLKIPTDVEIKEMIKETEKELEILKNLLKLNEKGREEAVIYICGLTHLKKYRKV
jgi:hypothetical protein